MSTIVAAGLKDFEEYLRRLPDTTTEAMRIAINDVATRKGLSLLRQAAYEQVNFPKGYLNNERLGVTSKATNNHLEATIKGRDRATSLARFAYRGQTASSTRGRGVRLSVKPKNDKLLEKAWLVNLNNGNTGLAVRLAPGEQLQNRRSGNSVTLAPDVYLLYGPSVDQVFVDVADQNGPEIGEMVASEFFRNLERLTRD